MGAASFTPTQNGVGVEKDLAMLKVCVCGGGGGGHKMFCSSFNTGA